MLHRHIAARLTAALAVLLALVPMPGWSHVSATGWPLAAWPQAATPPALPADLVASANAVDQMVAGEFARDNLASVTVGIVADGRLAWTRSYGQADMEKKVPATAESVYRIGSITKQFTALMLLQLVEQGKVRLSDPVEKYFPEVNHVSGRIPGAPPISLVELATMTSGLDREPANLDRYLKGPVSEWEKVLVAALSETKFAHEPDTRYLYSNIGYAILGAALGRAAGQPYTEYVQTQILAPLGMTHTAFEPNPAIAPAIARGYVVTENRQAGGTANGGTPRFTIDAETPAREHLGRGYKVPNGALYTTVGDLARFVAFELGADVPAVVKKATLEDNYSRVNSSDGALRTGYGIGFMLNRRGDTVVYGHGGSVAGYTAAAYFERTTRVGIVVLRNAGGGAVSVERIAVQGLDKLVTARKPRT